MEQPQKVDKAIGRNSFNVVRRRPITNNRLRTNRTLSPLHPPAAYFLDIIDDNECAFVDLLDDHPYFRHLEPCYYRIDDIFIFTAVTSFAGKKGNSLAEFKRDTFRYFIGLFRNDNQIFKRIEPEQREINHFHRYKI